MEKIKDKDGNVKAYKEKIYLPNGRTKTFQSKKISEVKRWKEEMRVRVRKSKYLGLSMDTDAFFGDYATYWLESIVKVSLSNSTYQSYEARLRKHLLPRFKRQKLKSIQVREVNEMIKELSGSGHNNQGINLVIGTLKSLLNHAVLEGVIAQSPLARLKKLKVPNKPMSYWSKEDSAHFFQASGSSLIAKIVFFSLETGCRRGETCALTWDKVDFIRGNIEISSTRDRYGKRSTTKTGKIRYVPMSAVLTEFLQTLAQESKSNFVFAHQDGTEVNPHHLNRDFKKAQQNAGLKKIIRFHDLRHTFASHFAMKGGDSFSLQRLLGHSKPETTLRYTHLSEEHLKEQMERMSFNQNSPFSALATYAKAVDADNRANSKGFTTFEK